MNVKKWFAVFFSTLLLLLLLWAGVNFFIDPFGVFGDTLLSYSEYSMTQNPRVSKIAYLDRHYEEYDAYVVGCSKSSSLPTESLNKYFGASFYNMIMYGGDMYDIEKTVEYILENYTAGNIVVAIGLEEANAFNTEADEIKGNLHAKVDGSGLVPFYFKYLFLNPEYAREKLTSYFNRSYLITSQEVFISETGTYNKSLRDSEKIPVLEKYLEENPDFSEGQGKYKMKDADKCVESLGRIDEMCREHGATLTVIACPIYEGELKLYDESAVISYYKKIAETVNFWNFSGHTAVSSEPRYFYDSLHFRNCVGEMMLAKMFSDSDVFVPEKFGEYITSENCEEMTEYLFSPAEEENTVKNLPVLMYHHFGRIRVSAELFDEHLTALENAGYTVISLADAENYVKRGEELPEKPVLITVDDGYSSAVDIAAPILEKHNAHAAVAVIGCSIGHSTYKDTDIGITEHFSLEEALPYVKNGTLTVISHTWDMHMVKSLDGEDCREGVLMLEGESEEDYLEALEEDFEKISNALFEAYGTKVLAVAYPQGLYSKISEVFLAEKGVNITFTTEWGTNQIVKGVEQTLRQLCRFSVDGSVDGETLVKILEGAG